MTGAVPGMIGAALFGFIGAVLGLMQDITAYLRALGLFDL